MGKETETMGRHPEISATYSSNLLIPMCLVMNPENRITPSKDLLFLMASKQVARCGATSSSVD